MCDIELREKRAFENMCLAIDMKEQFERLSINNHKSFLPHLCVYKVRRLPTFLRCLNSLISQCDFCYCTSDCSCAQKSHDTLLFNTLWVCSAQCSRDILLVGDVWATDLSPLELQNAETKRVASSSGSRRLQMSSSGQSVAGLKTGTYGPPRLITTRGYSTTMALSTMKHVLSHQELLRGNSTHSLPDSRRKVRLFGQGRTKTLSSHIKYEHVEDYEPREDTCIRAFVRLLAQAATAACADGC